MNRYTKKDEEYIRNNFEHKPNKELARHLGKTTTSVRDKLKRMGLFRPYTFERTCRAGTLLLSVDKHGYMTEQGLNLTPSWRLIGRLYSVGWSGDPDHVGMGLKEDWGVLYTDYPELKSIYHAFSSEGDFIMFPIVGSGYSDVEDLKPFIGWPMAMAYDSKTGEYTLFDDKDTIEGYPKVTEEHIKLPELCLRLVWLAGKPIPISDDVEFLYVSDWNPMMSDRAIYVFLRGNHELR